MPQRPPNPYAITGLDRMAMRRGDIAALARALPEIKAALWTGGVKQIEGVGANVLGSPAHALGFLADLVAKQPFMEPIERIQDALVKESDRLAMTAIGQTIVLPS